MVALGDEGVDGVVADGVGDVLTDGVGVALADGGGALPGSDPESRRSTTARTEINAILVTAATAMAIRIRRVARRSGSGSPPGG